MGGNLTKSLRKRLCGKLSDPENIRRLFDRLDHDAAFLPYWPEMLDFELPENAAAEFEETTTYREAFKP